MSVQRAGGAVVRGPDLDLDGAQPRAREPRRWPSGRAGQHGVDGLLQRLERDAEVDQGAEEHVAGDAGRGVDPEDARHAAISPQSKPHRRRSASLVASLIPAHLRLLPLPSSPPPPPPPLLHSPPPPLLLPPPPPPPLPPPPPPPLPPPLLPPPPPSLLSSPLSPVQR